MAFPLPGKGTAGQGVPPGEERAHLRPLGRRDGQAGGATAGEQTSPRPLPAGTGSHVPQPLPGGREPGRRGCHVRERKRPGGRPEAAPTRPPPGCSSFPVPSALAGPFPTSARLRSRLPRSPQCFLPSLPTPPAHHGLPREGFHRRVRRGRPAGSVECWKNNLSLRL